MSRIPLEGVDACGRLSRRSAIGGLAAALIAPLIVSEVASAATRSIQLPPPTLTPGMLPRLDGACVTGPDGTVYLIGGERSGQPIADVSVLVPGQGWFRGTPLNRCRTRLAAAVLPDSRLLVCGGQGCGGALVDVEIFDPSLGSWGFGPPLLRPRFGHAASASGIGIVVVGGAGRSGLPLVTAEFFDGSNWRQL